MRLRIIKPSIAKLVQAKHIFWDAEEQALWLDFRHTIPSIGVLRLENWDNMMFGKQSIPNYPSDLNLSDLPAYSDLRFWLNQIPVWVVESCCMFPHHQLTLLHYAGRYPQILELLDHAPILAWKLVKQGFPEHELLDLFQCKRIQIVERLGWLGRSETVNFFTRLRLRKVDSNMLTQMDVCLLDPQRLKGLNALPRINSMALSLAARFPSLIGHRLHVSLARMPCRPMQCASMVAMLDDVYRLAAFMQLENVTQQIGHCRYLVEVDNLYQAWLAQSIKTTQRSFLLDDVPHQLTTLDEYYALSRLQQHAWWLDFNDQDGLELWAWRLAGETVGVLVQRLDNKSLSLIRVRVGLNMLPSAKKLGMLELWLAQRNQPED